MPEAKKNKDRYAFKMKKGLDEGIVREISAQKGEPQWVLDIRLNALKVYEKLSLPTWGPDLSELDMGRCATRDKGHF